jgi:hypothetical protein
MAPTAQNDQISIRLVPQAGIAHMVDLKAAGIATEHAGWMGLQEDATTLPPPRRHQIAVVPGHPPTTVVEVSRIEQM